MKEKRSFTRGSGRKILLFIIIFSWLLLVGCSGEAEPSAKEGAHSSAQQTFENINLSNEPSLIVFQNVSIIPMNKEQVLENQNVVINEGLITKIGDFETVAIPDGATIIDGEDKYLLPGMVDMHVHLGRDSEEEMLYLANGVTGVQNMWGHPENLEMREAINDRKVLSPRIYTTGPLMDGPDPFWKDSMILETPEEARDAVIKVQEEGYDAVKVYERLTLDVYEEIMKTAKEIGIPVVGHVPQNVGIAKVLDLEQDSIEHLSGYNLDRLEEEAAITAKNHIWNTPTLTIVDIVKEEEEVEGLEFVDPKLIRYWNRLRARGHYDFDLEIRQNIVRTIHGQGGRLLAGTDANNPFIVPGFSLHNELEYLTGAGLTPFQVLKTATYNPAEFLGKLDQLGTVEEGKEAYVILLSKNPLEDIKNTRTIEGTMIQGVWLDKELMEEELRRLEESY